MKKSLFTVLALAFCLPVFSQPDLSLEFVANGFTRLVDITNCGDDRLFVVERNGYIRVILADGTVMSNPFLDIDQRVDSGQSEQGLLGLAFHPDYFDNGYFYVYYIDNDENTQLSRFSVANDPNTADPNSELKIFNTSQPFWNHNGGCIKFGPDGYLYISLGDGGSGNDPLNSGQDRLSLLGKMLRIDVDNGSPYSIPTDNPFAMDDFTLDEIWSLGLRNVWRFSFDAVTGDMWMGDVGQDAWEEINFQRASSAGGENYGWRCYEANDPNITNGCPDASEMTFPVFDYPNSFQQGCSVTGGFVYRGCEMPGLYGHYIFADFCSGKFWSITPDPNATVGWTTVELANLNDNNFSSFGENNDGELFVIGHGNGTVSKITSSSGMLTGTDETIAGAADGTISFTIPTNAFASVLWNDGSTEINRTNLEPGVYTVEVTTLNNCVFTEEIEILEGIVSSFEQLGISDIVLTPNPFKNNLQLRLTTTGPLEAVLHFTDVQGKTIQHENIAANGVFEKTFALHDLPAGVYYFTIKNENGKWSERVVKK
ncbi:MAG: PQQ-dependent sugar dehydrogenase [Bacteroidota bacterium]